MFSRWPEIRGSPASRRIHGRAGSVDCRWHSVSPCVCLSVPACRDGSLKGSGPPVLRPSPWKVATKELVSLPACRLLPRSFLAPLPCTRAAWTVPCPGSPLCSCPISSGAPEGWTGQSVLPASPGKHLEWLPGPPWGQSSALPRQTGAEPGRLDFLP